MPLRLFFFVTLFVAAVVGRAAQSRPNILVAMADDWSYPHAGAYGCAWVKTPAFDRVAQEGVLFTRAYTPNAKCAPSRSSVLTGRNSWQLEDSANHWNFFPSKFKTYAEALEDAGYFTGYTGKGWAPGRASTADGAPRALLGASFDEKTLVPPTSAISKNDYAGNFGAFLDASPQGAPWCFWYGSTEPHRGYEYGSGVAKGGKHTAEVDRVPGYWPDDAIVRNDLLDYAFEVEHFDRHLGLMLAELESRGQLENTLIIVTGDNGMPFPRAKGQAYEISNHLPLAVHWPAGIAHAGRTVEDYVSFIDFAPTFLAAAGVDWEASGMSPSPGRPLLPLLASDRSGRIDPARDHVLIGKERHDIGRPHDAGYPIRGIVRDGWLYVHNFATDRWPAGNPETGYLNTDGGATKTRILELRRGAGANRYWDLAFGMRVEDELYHLEVDPDCLINLAGATAHARLRDDLHARLWRELEAQGDPRMAGRGDVFDAYPYADPKFRGFYEKWQRGEAPEPRWVQETDAEPDPIPSRTGSQAQPTSDVSARP